MNFKDAIRKMHDVSGVTYTVASLRMGRSSRYISSLLKSGGNPKLDTCAGIANAFGFRLIVRGNEVFYSIRCENDAAKDKSDITAEDAIRRITDACPQSNYTISKALGKPAAYITSAISRGTMPTLEAFVSIAEACGNEVLLRGHSRTYYLSKRARFSAANRMKEEGSNQLQMAFQMDGTQFVNRTQTSKSTAKEQEGLFIDTQRNNRGTTRTAAGQTKRVDERNQPVEIEDLPVPKSKTNGLPDVPPPMPKRIKGHDVPSRTPVENSKPTPNEEAKLAEYKQRLLDLSMRNNLLNYRDKKTGTIRVLTPDMATIYRRIVLNERPMTFRESSPEDDDQPKPDSESTITTEQSRAGLIRSLRRLDTVARSSIDEQGIGILYLAFGMLTWIDDAQKEHKAPLIMAPVRLTRASVRSPFILQAGDDDPVVNPTLVYYLEQTYGITLPVFEKENQLQRFFISVENLVRARVGWHVDADVVLSTFQFQKLSMYHDLEARSQEILLHPIVRAIMGDGSALSDVSELENPDSFEPTETYQVVDADASQQAAILAAHAGESFVLQGPPGTGKSQTITNIIADCLGSGKKVLFVSEKKAALDVVYHRLTQAKLDEFCLVLHSNKAGKKEVLGQLNHTLNLYGTRPRMSPAASTRLATMVRLRNDLNGYADAIYGPIDPLGRSPYEVIGAVSRYERDGIPWISCRIEGIRSITPSRIREMADAIRTYARELGNLGEAPKNNPWNTFGISNLEYGESGEVLHTFSQVSSGARELMDVWSRETAELEIDVSPTFNSLDASINLLDALSNMPVVPHGMSAISCSEARGLVSAWKASTTDLDSSADKLFETLEELGRLDPELNLDVNRQKLQEAGYTRELQEELIRRLDGSLHYSAWQKMPGADIDMTVEKLKNCVETYERQKDAILADYHPELMDIDFISMETRFKIEYRSLFKRMFGQRGDDLRTLSGLRRSSSQVDDEEALRILGLLHDLSNEEKALDEQSNDYETILGTCYRGMRTDFDLIARKRDALSLAQSCLALLTTQIAKIDRYDAQSRHLSEVFEDTYVPEDPSWADRGTEVIESLESLLSAYKKRTEGVGLGNVVPLLAEPWIADTAKTIADELKMTLRRRRGVFEKAANRASGANLERRSLDQLANAIDKATSAGTVSLERSVSYLHAKKACTELGLEGFIDAIARDSRAMEQDYLDQYDLILRHTIYRIWLGSVALAERPALRDFSAREHERRIEKFTQLDAEQLNIDQTRVLSELFPRIPSSNVRARGRDEISILLRELNKKSRIRPIRKLFADIPHAVLALKPCLMMSPLSVSTYLESATFQFDTVIFDEASQVRTEDALGVISRGKQVIIAGDSKQLPPTNFFAATVAEDDDEGDDEYYDQAGSFDSVLDEAALLNPISLKWHYRSRDESLITFSNDEIYDGNLFTFPSNRTSAKDSGVEYVYVANGIYEGSRKGNLIEATRVADLVMTHFATYGTERSLGVIALGENQARVIENELMKRRLDNPITERFFDTGADEPFFVKNLENVQGDERDTIILSVGYGKAQNGKLSHNFGPINLEGGERRLNVAVTRARINLKLVTSLDPSEIDSDRVSNVGPRMLKDYLAYAKMGPSVDSGTMLREYGYVDEDSFANVVRDVLAQAGFDVEEKVGRSGCKVDLAVRHPEHKDCFCIGIVCDGDSYHAATTARDRDRLRTQVLNGMGWSLYHVWARSWMQDSEKQASLLIDAVKKAIETFVPPAEREPVEVSVPEQMTEDKAEPDERKSDSHGDEVQVEEAESKLESDYMEVEHYIEKHRYGFQDYPTYRPPRRGAVSDFGLLKQFIFAQAPFSVDYFLQGYRKYCYGQNQRMNDTIRRTGIGYLQTKLKDIAVLRKEHGSEYVFRRDQRSIIPRVAGGRNIADISTSELREGVMAVLRGYMGELDRAGLIDETTAAFEFPRRGRIIEQRIGEAIDDLRLYGKVRIVDGYYVPTGR